MRFPYHLMPDGLPMSLWFFVATAVLYLLQRFPFTGIFLMFMLAAFWSIALINLGFIGVGYEALTGRVSRLWLVLPLAYFGLYYLAYAREQMMLPTMRADYTRHNSRQKMPFNPDTQDLLIDVRSGEHLVGPDSFLRDYGLGRAFSESGQVLMLGDQAACDLVRGNKIYASANVRANPFYEDGEIGRRKIVPGFCFINAPGTPDRPIVRVESKRTASDRFVLPLTEHTHVITNVQDGRQVSLKAGVAAMLRPFPMPIIGCFLNSGAAKWQCTAGFMRTNTAIIADGKKWENSSALVASALGLPPSKDYARAAAGRDVIQAIGDEADRALVAKEVAKLELMLADPSTDVRDGWFRHLTNRPDVVEPYTDRIFAALGTLQRSDLKGSGNGRNLWRLVAVLPDPTLQPFRPRMIDWLSPGIVRKWTTESGEIFNRLDATVPVEREIVLNRLETSRGDLQTSLLRGFCRMGAVAPDDVKARLLAIWRARAPTGEKGQPDFRRDGDTILYTTLARMGLKQEAGKVEQRYAGPTFLAIWEHVTPDTPDDICSDNEHELRNRFRKL